MCHTIIMFLSNRNIWSHNLPPENVKMYNGYVDPTNVLGGYHCKKRVYEFTVMFTFYREYKNNDKINASPPCGGWQL